MAEVRTFDTVIIGAGIQGLSVAYFLSLNRRRSVAVVEVYSRAGMGSSSRSGSMIMKSRENKPKIEMSLFSFRFFETFKERFKEDLVFRRTGFLSLVGADVAERYEREHKLRLELGVPSEQLSVTAIAEMCPVVSTDGIDFGVHCPDDGEIDSAQILRCYEREATKNGVVMFFNEEAIGLETRNGGIEGIWTNKGFIACQIVVNAAGPGAPEISRWMGIRVPQDNRRRSIYYCRTKSNAFNSGPMVEDAVLEWYYRGLPDGRILIGMGYEPDGAPTDGPNEDFLPEVRRATAHRAPDLADFEVLGGHSGIRPMSPDILPVIGPSKMAPQLFFNTGWGGEGIMHSPAGGAMLADLLDGSTHYTYSAEGLGPDRFLNQTHLGG